jgi:hypothetical protein
VCARYVWLLYSSGSEQLVLTPEEVAAAQADPLLSRAAFNATTFMTAHSVSPQPVAVSWQRVHVDEYVAWTWATVQQLAWEPQASRDKLQGYLAASCKALGY